MKNTSLFIVALMTAMSVMAQIPKAINFQGNLTVPGTTTPVTDGDYTIDFSIHDAPTGGTLGWTETQTVAVFNGIFNVKLGAVEPLDPYLFDRPVWLELTVAGESLSPRVELSSTPYSLNTATFSTPYTKVPAVGPAYIAGDTSTQNYPFGPTIDLAIDDNDTGLDVPSDGNLSFYTNGVERMTLDLVGSLFLGSSTGVGANTKLEVNYDDLGSGAGFGGMWISSSNTTGQPYYGYQNGNGQAYTYLDGGDGNKWKLFNGGLRMTVTPAGNVGIGTTNPPERLSVSGNIAASDSVKADAFALNSVQSRSIVILNDAFVTAGTNPSLYPYRNLLTGDVTYLLRTVGGTSGILATFTAQVFGLPDKAVITRIDVYFYDADATYDAILKLYSQSFGSTTSTLIGTVTSVGSTGIQTQSTTTITDGIVDTQNNGYKLIFNTRESNTSLGLYSVKIFYTTRNPGQ